MPAHSSPGAFRQGVVILVALAALTGVEYAVAVMSDLWTALVVLALVKAGLVLQYFMHLPRVLAPDEDGGHA